MPRHPAVLLTVALHLVTAFAWLIGSLPSAGSAAETRAPNLVLILADNLGQDWLGCYGSDENCTPHIDALAAGGTRFQHCYMTAYCSTSRVSLLTGRYGFRTGWTTHHDAAIYGGGGFDWNREKTFAAILKSAGYATVLTGKWQINDLLTQPEAIQASGFDEHLVWTGSLVGEGTAEERFAASIAPGGERELESRYWDSWVFRNGQRTQLKGRFGPDEYLNYLIDFIQRHRDQPFLAYYATPLVHVPPVTTPTSPDENALDRDKFKGMLRYLDAQVGTIVDTLERLGLRENTLVIFTTDNGSSRKFSGTVQGKMVRGGLGGVTEPGLDVPLIVNAPGLVPAGRVSDALVDCTDFMATFAEVAGAKLPRDYVIDGRSFAGELGLTSTKAAARDWIFTQYHKRRVVRDHRFKLYSSGELFDVQADWMERKNLVDRTDPELVAARQRLQAVLDRMPADHPLPFTPRSGSAFRLQATPNE